MISFIVPVYNVEKYLERCLESILRQTSQDFEIVLVDDGSTDSSGEICDKYAEIHNCISVYHKKNGGLASARNYALKYVKGEWIAFVDSDDWIEEDYVEEVLKVSNSNHQYESIVFGYYIDYVENDYTLHRKLEINNNMNLPQVMEQMEKKGMFNSVCNKLYSNQLLQKYEIRFEKGMEPGEDLLFNCNYFQHISTCSVSDRELYHYMRQGENTLTKKYDPNLYEKIQFFDKARVDLYDALKMRSERYQNLLYKYYFAYITSCVYNNYGLGNGVSFRKRIIFYQKLFSNARLSMAIEKLQKTDTLNSLYEKLFIKLYGLKNAVVMELVYKVLFFFRNYFKGFYNAFRKRIFKNEG